MFSTLKKVVLSPSLRQYSTAISRPTVSARLTQRFAPQSSNWRQFSCSANATQDQLIKEFAKKELDGTDPDLKDILAQNDKWAEETKKTHPGLFDKIGVGQNPHYLYIGCADARVDPTIMMGLDYGELFVHRNVGNVVQGNDLNSLAVIEYAVNVLKVPHIIVCGHYDCGAVRASMKKVDHGGVVENWIRCIRDVRRLHAKELSLIEDDEQKHRRMVELNVVEQCLNVLKSGTVQKRRAETQLDDNTGLAFPRVHALVFDPALGKLKKLDVNWDEETKKHDDLYNLYPETENM